MLNTGRGGPVLLMPFQNSIQGELHSAALAVVSENRYSWPASAISASISFHTLGVLAIVDALIEGQYNLPEGSYNMGSK
jgi:hypothetical protein